jgi:4-hydroxy-3-methylbut-2-enyl diphosphate reductase IspH
MIMSVSTLMIFSGAATPSSVVNLFISAFSGFEAVSACYVSRI